MLNGAIVVFLVGDTLHWSASDLASAALCEYATLRALDYKLGRVDSLELKWDPLQEHIARLGDRHEARILDRLKRGSRVAVLEHVERPHTVENLSAAEQATREAFASDADVIYQPALFDGEFFGYADFVLRTDQGWQVCDAKLARSAKPAALLQLGAYADQVARLGLPLSSTVSLLLGSGDCAEFPVSDVLPVFIERRERLRELLNSHRTTNSPVEWGDDRLIACGTCAECVAAAERHDDVILVAGLRADQRRRLRLAGMKSIGDLASATAKPDGMARSTFEKLRAQAALQWKQMQAVDSDPIDYELTATAPKMLALLPAPSEGDLFFDFEGDPLYDEGDPSRVGLEYLCGMVDSTGKYQHTWAHSFVDERKIFTEFIDLVTARLALHPDLHVYHYAPYETTALKRLAMRYMTREEELDSLLRSEVFVDLYATVRGSLRVAQPSYSIKKLEPLYMGDQLRESDVADGAGSIVAYQEYRNQRHDDPAAATRSLDSLADYNGYDCLSTLRLRDWLLERATDAGVRDQIAARTAKPRTSEPVDDDPLFAALMARSGSDQPSRRTSEQQAYAMLAASIDYYQREEKQFWWEHFDRLGHPIDDWGEARDVFILESAEVLEDWAVPGGRASNARRTLQLVGDWTPGSRPGSAAHVVYATPAPPKSFGPDGSPYAAAEGQLAASNADDPRSVTLTESRKSPDTYADTPVALVPGRPPGATVLADAIHEVANSAARSTAMPSRAVLDLLARRRPRLVSGNPLPVEGSTLEKVVAALVGMTDSYVAIQGPPGAGKTFTGSRVIKELVEKHHWRIGVVAQSHAAVENMLASIVKAGTAPDLVGKAGTKSSSPSWTLITNRKEVRFLDDHVDSGCVVGGTAWTFANAAKIPRDSLDLLVVDEAGQFALAPTISASVAAKRLLLLGDPQQLPQVSQGTHAESVNESALGWLMDGHHTIPGEFGYFLDKTYRMHPALCARVSTLSYDGRLTSADQASERDLNGVAPGLQVIELDHNGNRTESPEEAAEVVTQVRRYLGLLWTNPDDTTTPRRLDVNDILVVAPYNAQVACIQAALDDANLQGVRVGTVDKFQGQEAPIAIVSMTASSHGDVPRGMGFLLNRNRINVAVSRAQWKAIVIRSGSLTSYMPSNVDGVLELGAFIGLCSLGPPNAPQARHRLR